MKASVRYVSLLRLQYPIDHCYRYRKTYSQSSQIAACITARQNSLLKTFLHGMATLPEAPSHLTARFRGPTLQSLGPYQPQALLTTGSMGLLPRGSMLARLNRMHGRSRAPFDLYRIRLLADLCMTSTLAHLALLTQDSGAVVSRAKAATVAATSVAATNRSLGP